MIKEKTFSYEIVNYPKDKGYSKTFYEVLNFLSELNENHECLHFHWSRWEWMFARASFQEEELVNNLMFYENGKLKGLILFEDSPEYFFVLYHQDKDLKEAMIEYIVNNSLEKDLIVPSDDFIIKLLEKQGYEKTDWIDPITRFSLEDFEIKSIPGYKIVSLAEDYRLDCIHHALWRGFNHGDEIDYSDENLLSRKSMTSSPHFKKEYTFVAIKDNQYQSYAGIWYIPNTKTALIEPVATVPEHRKKGLAQACILNCINAAKKDGAKDIFVGANMKFYLDMGFTPYQEAYRFKKVNKE
jgi:N-acetylglutamate synthase-like GNAT family acetyltransferase